MSVLVDSSIWIDYFKSGNNSDNLDFLIDENQIVINELILSELVPILLKQKQKELIELLYSIDLVKLKINWKEIIDMQTICLRKGINKVGIPDLIITQNCIQNNLKLYSLDKHFKLIHKVTKLQVL